MAKTLETIVWTLGGADGDDKIDLGYVHGPVLRQEGNRLTIQVTGFSYDGGEYLEDPNKVVQMLCRTQCGATFDAKTMTYTDYDYNWDEI